MTDCTQAKLRTKIYIKFHFKSNMTNDDIKYIKYTGISNEHNNHSKWLIKEIVIRKKAQYVPMKKKLYKIHDGQKMTWDGFLIF